MDQFVNRIEELDRLQTLYESGTAELAIIYGRRQIGKSELVRQSIADRDDAVYYQAVQGTATTQLRRFVEAAASTYPDITAVKEEWEPLLTYLTDRDAVIVIDEFPYLIESNEGLPSVIQHLWDTATDESQATLVLTGSAIGMIHTHVPRWRCATLRTGVPDTEWPPRTHPAAVSLHPRVRADVRSRRTGVRLWRLWRHTPISQPARSITEPRREHHAAAVRPEWPTPRRGETVLQMELNEVNTYFSVLESMASGKPQSKRDRSGSRHREHQHVVLLRPAGNPPDHRETSSGTRRSGAQQADSIQDSRSRIPVLFPVSLRPRGQYELYGENAYADLIEPELPDFVSETFESLCHQAVPALYADYQLTQVPSQWWYKGQEVDVVAPTDESTLIAGEAKFTNTPSAMTCSRTSKTTWSKSIGHPPEVVSRRMSSPCSAALGSNAPSRKLQTSVMTSAYSISPISLPFSRVEPPINAGG